MQARGTLAPGSLMEEAGRGSAGESAGEDVPEVSATTFIIRKKGN